MAAAHQALQKATQTRTKWLSSNCFVLKDTVLRPSQVPPHNSPADGGLQFPLGETQRFLLPAWCIQPGTAQLARGQQRHG